jgi:hypothetical protein
MVKNETIYIIYLNLFEDFKRFICLPDVEGFVDLNKNNQYEIIISCNSMNNTDQQVKLYEFKKTNNKPSFQLKAANQ